MSIALTEDGELNCGPHGPVYRYRRMTSLAGVIHLIIIGRGHDSDGTVCVVLEQFLGRFPGLDCLLICNIIHAEIAINTN